MVESKLEKDAKGGALPVDAATLIVLRDAPAAGASPDATGPAFSSFFVQRSQKSRFMGGAVVFPGGKVDDADRDPTWSAYCTDPPDPALRALGVAACREALEEAAILPLAGGTLDHRALLELRRRLAEGQARFLDLVRETGLRLDLRALHLLSRWVTPKNQSRRFDTRFFVTRATPGQEGAHDEHETVASFWATPDDVLARAGAGAIELAPPTHRTLEILAKSGSVDEVFSAAAHASRAVICPELVPHVDRAGETVALTLPGDPEHSVREVRVPGASRFVLRNGAWRPESPPRLPSPSAQE